MQARRSSRNPKHFYTCFEPVAPGSASKTAVIMLAASSSDKQYMPLYVQKPFKKEGIRADVAVSGMALYLEHASLLHIRYDMLRSSIRAGALAQPQPGERAKAWD